MAECSWRRMMEMASIEIMPHSGLVRLQPELAGQLPTGVPAVSDSSSNSTSTTEWGTFHQSACEHGNTSHATGQPHGMSVEGLDAIHVGPPGLGNNEMTKHLQRDMENLQHELLSLSALVEDMIAKATRALREKDIQLACEVIDSDGEIDAREVHVEEKCLAILALHQPVAIDLRRIATSLKVNSDLERMADLAVNVAERAKHLAQRDFVVPSTIDWMVDIAANMVREALDALVELDVALARKVCAKDDEVDELNRQVIDELLEIMHRDPSKVEAALHCFSAARHLERIADHATNIAEDVIYLVDGEITRHRNNQPELR